MTKIQNRININIDSSDLESGLSRFQQSMCNLGGKSPSSIKIEFKASPINTDGIIKKIDLSLPECPSCKKITKASIKELLGTGVICACGETEFRGTKKS